MEKEYIAGEPQRYEIGGRVFIVEPRYRKDGESMADILLKLKLHNRTNTPHRAFTGRMVRGVFAFLGQMATNRSMSIYI